MKFIDLQYKERGEISLLFVKAFSFSLLFFLASTLTAQVVISEVFSGGSFELRNTGNSSANISSYWICDFPDYRRLDQLTLECGSLDLAPGEEVVLTAPGLHETNDSELGLYTRNSFGDASALASYVEWGSSGHQRSGLAVQRGFWDGNAAPAFNNSQSLEVSGNGTAASDWSVNSSPMACATGDGMSDDEQPPACNVEGGAISTTDRTSLCVDGNPDPINVTPSGGSGSQRGWVITDDQRNILALPAAPPFDLDGAGPGICFIYYIAYEPGLTGLATGQNLANLVGCYDLSNRIEVIRQTPDGGTVTTQGGMTSFTATAGNVMVPVTFSTTATALSYWYIITDENDDILAFVNPAMTADPNNVVLDLSAAPPGECHIWGWSYRGEGDPIPGDNISTLTDGDCEAISTNFITVNREATTGCETPTNPTMSRVGRSRIILEWAPVNNAKGYIIQARLKGQTGWAITAFLRTSGAKIWATPNKDFEYRLKTICKDESESTYSPVYEFTTRGDFNNSASDSRSEFKADIDFSKVTTTSIKRMQVSPNPVLDRLQLTYEVETDKAQLSIFHVSGKKVFENILSKNDTVHFIDVSSFDTGFYFLVLKDGSRNIINKRIIKENMY